MPIVYSSLRLMKVYISLWEVIISLKLFLLGWQTYIIPQFSTFQSIFTHTLNPLKCFSFFSFSFIIFTILFWNILSHRCYDTDRKYTIGGFSIFLRGWKRIHRMNLSLSHLHWLFLQFCVFHILCCGRIFFFSLGTISNPRSVCECSEWRRLWQWRSYLIGFCIFEQFYSHNLTGIIMEGCMIYINRLNVWYVSDILFTL